MSISIYTRLCICVKVLSYRMRRRVAPRDTVRHFTTTQRRCGNAADPMWNSRNIQWAGWWVMCVSAAFDARTSVTLQTLTGSRIRCARRDGSATRPPAITRVSGDEDDVKWSRRNYPCMARHHAIITRPPPRALARQRRITGLTNSDRAAAGRWPRGPRWAIIGNARFRRVLAGRDYRVARI